MLNSLVIPVIVGLPAADIMDTMIISKLDYNRFHTECQIEHQKFNNTIDFNYITTEEWINSNLDKYQDILP